VLVAAAVCPHPPLLVPRVAGAAAPELDHVRDACRRALGVLASARADLLVVVGAGVLTREHDAGARGSLRPVGVPVDVTLGTATSRAPSAPELPLSLTVAAWLLDACGYPAPAPVVGLEVAEQASPDACTALGGRLAERAARVAMLVMADGSARRGPAAPGYADPRSLPLDDVLAAALRDGDADALAGLDPDLAADLLVQGRASLQVLAGAALGRPWQGRVLASEDRYGVLYLVATWTPPGRAEDVPPPART
jgi:hypothetical protein